MKQKAVRCQITWAAGCMSITNYYAEELFASEIHADDPVYICNLQTSLHITCLITHDGFRSGEVNTIHPPAIKPANSSYAGFPEVVALARKPRFDSMHDVNMTLEVGRKTSVLWS